MPGDIIPNPQPADPPQPNDPQRPQQGKTVTCECCGSKLDRHGNLLRRGELAKQMLDAEDSIDKLKKSLSKAEETNGQLRQEIDTLKSQIKPERVPLWKREA
jgi:hypothetical protein